MIRHDSFVAGSCEVPMTKPVLDACCGSKMFWFDKSNSRVLFVDKRRETLIDSTGKKPVEIVIDPDVLADFRALPFDDSSFSLVVFDPPHTFCGPNGRTVKKYGTLPADWRDMLALTEHQPLFGQKVGNTKTHWLVFMKDTP